MLLTAGLLLALSLGGLAVFCASEGDRLLAGFFVLQFLLALVVVAHGAGR